MVKCKCNVCGKISDADDLDLDSTDSPAYCPNCESSDFDMTECALRYAEAHGIYQYYVNNLWIEYWSFFKGEGFRFVRHHLLTCDENRETFIPWTPFDNEPIPKFLISEDGGRLYNYNVG